MKVFEYTNNETDYLKKRDEKLGTAIEKIGHINREVIPDLFTALINSIVAQQISSKALNTVWSRLIEQLDEITPACIANTDEAIIQKCGISFRKAKYIKNAADCVLNGDIDLNNISKLSDEEIIKKLSRLNGIGEWTAEMLLIFSLQRKNVLSYNDLAIQRGIKMLYAHDSIDKELFNKYKNLYSPYASVASLYLWAIAGGAQYN